MSATGFGTITAIVPVLLKDQFLEGYLEECLRSVVDQTLPADEIIVIDDGSPRSVEAFLEQFDFADRLGIIRLAKNSGVPSARNAGLRAASGDWIANLDHDDAWTTTKLETQAAYLRGHPELAGADSYMNASYPDGRTLLWGTGRTSFCLQEALKENQIFNQMLLIRRSALLAAGGFDPDVKIWDDQGVSIRLATAGFKIGHIEQPLGLHRRHDRNTSGNAWAMVRDGLGMLWKYRTLYRRMFGWRGFPARTAFILETAGRKRGRIFGRILRLAANVIRPFGSYAVRGRSVPEVGA